MTDTIPLSPAANAVWEAFNQDEAGVFVDYGDKLAAALRAVVEHLGETHAGFDLADMYGRFIEADDLLAIAAELEDANSPSENG